MTIHSKIGASSYYRWGKCPGSVKLSEGLETPQSVYAEEGTLAHNYAADLLLGKAFPDGVIDPEMLDAITTYVNYVHGIHNHTEGAKIYIEQKFDLSHLYPGLFGTSDCVVFAPKEKHLWVIDYKHGQGIPVEVLEEGKPNVQLLYYALGALFSTGVPCDTIELVIVQPRCYHPNGPIRSYVFDAHQILDFASDLIDAAKRTADPNAPIVSGDHCRFCPAAGICPELSKKAVALAQSEFSPVTNYDPQKLSRALEWLPTLESWIKSVREFAYAEAQHGRCPPGWKLVAKRATRRWKDESAVEQLGHALGLEGVFFERSVRSVAQIEKELGKKNFADKVGHLVTSESSGYTLAPESDKRESVRLDAKSEFTKIEN